MALVPLPLPAGVKVGPAVYQVQRRRIDSDKLGTTQGRKHRISLTPKQSVPSSRDTLLHETLHAVCNEAGLGMILGIGEDDEERLILLLTPWLLGVLRDNPYLIEFLLDEAI